MSDTIKAQLQKILALAESGVGGEIEFDDDAKVSESDDNGAYVQAWVWVSFSGTEFDKDKNGEKSEATV